MTDRLSEALDFEPCQTLPSYTSPPPMGGFCYISINRRTFRVSPADWPIGEFRRRGEVSSDHDLWRVYPGGDDVKVADDGFVRIVTSGLRFYTAPRFINGGAPESRLDAMTRAEKLRAVAQAAHDNGDCICEQPDTVTITISREDAEEWAEEACEQVCFDRVGGCPSRYCRLEFACRAALIKDPQ